MLDDMLEVEFNKLKEKLAKSDIDLADASIDDIVYRFESKIPKEYRKKHGIVYTPQWVADGMCELAIRKWLKYTTNLDISDSIQKEEARILLNKLNNIKICDPCVGSGVYIFSIINTLTSIYQQIYSKLDTEYKPLEVLRNIIHNNIFGIDIDSNAVSISVFRLWVFLRYNGYEGELKDFKTNICIGDSISSYHEGLNIGYSRDLEDVPEHIADVYREEWQEAWDSYIDTIKSQDNEIKVYKAKAKVYNTALEISHAITGQDIAYKIDWKMLKNGRIKAFNWRLTFSDVYNTKNGFDIIIGNPPYVRNNELDADIVEDSILGKSADLYMYFLDLWKLHGNKTSIASMITPNNWFSAAYAKQFRSEYKSYLDSIIDFNMHYVFDGVYTATAITTISNKGKDTIEYANIEYIMEDNKEAEMLSYIESRIIQVQKSNLNPDIKFIFGEKDLYSILEKLKQFKTLEKAYGAKAIKGIVVADKDRIDASQKRQDYTGPYLAMGKDVNTFETLCITGMVPNIDIENVYDNSIMIPEVTRRIRGCRIKNIIPLDSAVVVYWDNPNALALINSYIFNAIYNIMISTNYCISYSEVRFPRKNKQIVNVPVPSDISLYDDIRQRTNNYESVKDEDISDINKITQQLYGLSDREVELLLRYDI